MRIRNPVSNYGSKLSRANGLKISKRKAIKISCAYTSATIRHIENLEAGGNITDLEKDKWSIQGRKKQCHIISYLFLYVSYGNLGTVFSKLGISLRHLT
jgi:hypothetical protein